MIIYKFCFLNGSFVNVKKKKYILAKTICQIREYDCII